MLKPEKIKRFFKKKSPGLEKMQFRHILFIVKNR